MLQLSNDRMTYGLFIRLQLLHLAAEGITFITLDKE